MSIEILHKRNLENARKEEEKKLHELREKIKDTQKVAKELGTVAKSVLIPGNIFSLFSQINLLVDWTYFLAIFCAILKDVLDFVGIGSLPAIGTAVTFMVSSVIAFMMILANFMEKDRTTFQKTLMRWIAIIIGTLIEFLFGLNFFPVETAVALFVFLMALASRKQREQATKKKFRTLDQGTYYTDDYDDEPTEEEGEEEYARAA